MTTEAALLAAIPDDPLAAFVLADFLEEQGDRRGDLLRLLYTLTRTIDAPDGPRMEDQMRALLDQGIRAIGPYRTVPVAPRRSLTFAWVPPGAFLMGSLLSDTGRDPDEGPQHPVRLTRGFWLGTLPITQGIWEAVMSSNPSSFPGKNRPVERISWHDCQEFCRLLGERTGQRFRLPTEAEWEYACRAGTTTPYHAGNDVEALKKTGWSSYDGSHGSAEETMPVGRLQPNAFGLYDMHGNVWEWCADWCDPRYYERGPVLGPPGPDTGSARILRGGSWYEEPRYSRSSHRCWYAPDTLDERCGCRLVLCSE